MSYLSTEAITAAGPVRCATCWHRAVMHQLGAPIGEHRCLAEGCGCANFTHSPPAQAGTLAPAGR